MSKTSKRTAIVMPTEEEDRAITLAALCDPDAQPLTPGQLQAMVPIRALRGRPKSESRKLLVSVRYSPEVLDYFRSTGDGWQSRMDRVLLQYVHRQTRSSFSRSG
jgi:uncharacterized protein (DUF4415 family)